MEKKKILVYRTDDDSIKNLGEMFADSNWEMESEKEQDNFILQLSSMKHHLVIAESKTLGEDIREVLDNCGLPVIFISDNKEMNGERVTMPEAFSINDLKKAMTKASFLKVAGAAGSREESSLDCEKEDAVLLEPVFGEEEGTEAVVLTSEEENENIRSSWEIPSKEDLDQEESFNSKQGIDIEKKKKPAERVSDKERIFDRMDEIDNLIQSLNEDIAGDSPFETRQPVSEPLQNEVSEKESSSGDLFGVENDGSDDIFSSEYQFSDEEEDRTVEIVSEKEKKRESASAIMEDFESIVSEGSSAQADDEESGPLILEKEEPESPPEEEQPEELSAEYDISEDTGESEEAEILGEVVEAEPVEEVEAVPVEEVEAVPVEDYKKEIHAWLEKNGRKIIKEVIEEQLSKIWEKK